MNNGLDQIPDSSAEDGDIYIQNIPIPYDDLALLGNLPRLLKLFKDVPVVISMMYGMSENGPRLVSVSPDNSLRIAGGMSGYSRISEIILNIAPGALGTFTFSEECGLWIISWNAQGAAGITDSGSLLFLDQSGAATGNGFTIMDGERWVVPFKAFAIQIRNNSLVTYRGRVVCADFLNVQDSFVRAQ